MTTPALQHGVPHASGLTIPLVIPRGSEVSGAVTCPGTVQVDGRFDGLLACDSVIVGAQAYVRGEIVARSVTLFGTVEADVYANNIVLKPSSRVVGALYHSQLTLEENAFFEGKSRRSNDPRSFALTRLKAAASQGTPPA